MNPEKKDYNGWILCPSTRFFGKFYYFNPATGEAVWNLSDMERRMAQPNFTHSDKWHMYPEPDCPPEDTANTWGYQPDVRVFPQASPQFGQAVFPKYTPNVMDVYPPSMPWGIPQSMYMPVPTYNPMAQSWPNYRGNPKHFMQERSLFPNPYMQKVPNFGQSMSRQVFGMKPKPNVQIFPQMSNQKEIPIKRIHPTTDFDNEKEPLFKRLRSQTDLQNENSFSGKNPFQSRLFENMEPERASQPFKTPVFRQPNTTKICDCMLSKSHTLSQFSKSRDNLTNIGRTAEQIFKPATLSRAKSMESLLAPPSEISSNFSLQNSFVFPLNKSDSKVSSTKVGSPKKKVQNATVSQSGQESKKQSESSDSKLSETDLRYTLMARRRKSSVGELHEMNQAESKKIKTSYSENNLGESCSKKRVTFDLGIEDSVVNDDGHDVDAPYATETVEAEASEVEVAQSCYVIADTDVLLTEFEMIEEFVKSDETYTLLIPESILRDIESMCGGLGGGARNRVNAARHIARRIADKHPYIQVQPEDSERGGETDDAALNCCLRVFDEGYLPMLVTNNSDLYTKAISNNVECYTTKDIQEYMATPKPDVTFDIKKTDSAEIDEIQTPNEITPSITVNCSRRKLFESTHSEPNPKQFFLNKRSDNNQIFLGGTKDISPKKRIDLNKNSFFDKIDIMEETQLNRTIEKLNLQEKFDNQKNREALAVKKLQKEKENSFAFKNGDESKEEAYAAKRKVKSINIYNLDGLLKSFSVKSEEMEERIRTRMDEYVCVFCQIMEAIFFDILKDFYTHSAEDFTKSPLQNQLAYMREAFPDHRTALVLIDKLSNVLDCAFVLNSDGRIKLDLNPHGFVKMLACGTLLVKVLQDILQSEPALEEGEVLLAQLERSVEEWSSEPEPQPAPPAPGACLEPRPEYVKKPSEVLQFLTKHFPEWRAYSATENDKQTVDKHNNKTEVSEKPTSKVLRTFGRNLGLLKLDLSKTLNLSNNKVINGKENEMQTENNNNDKDRKNKNDKKINKPKLLKKLAVESLNLPPKFKEIDVEKRENDNKELTDMLEEMVQKKPLTKFYEFNTIIVDKNRKGTKEIDSSKNNYRMSFKSDTEKKELKRNVKIQSITKIEPNKTIDTVKNDKSKIENNNVKLTNKDDIQNNILINNDESNNSNNKQIDKVDNNALDILDLDVLDYSEMDESVIQDKPESIIDDDSSSDKLEIVESDNCNDVTTTQISNEASPIGKGNDKNDNSKDNNDNINDINDKNDNSNENNDINENNECSENDDSGIDSCQAYSFAQRFLIDLTKTFLMIKEFIEASIRDLDNKVEDDTLELLYQMAKEAHTRVIRITDGLNLIVARESNPETAVQPILMTGDPGPDVDKRMCKYSRIIWKCVSMSRVLQRSLQIVQRIAHRDLSMGDLSDHHGDYTNLFE